MTAKWHVIIIIIIIIIIVIIIVIIIFIIIGLSRVTVAAELRLSVWPSYSHIRPTLMQPP